MCSNVVPHFFIVTPCRNAAAWIDSAIASVATQEGAFYIHFHVQDGGSTDGTLEQLQNWQRVFDNTPTLIRCCGLDFTWASAPDRGMYDAINKGFTALRVPPEGIMAWINADDTYVQHAFSTVARVFADVPELQWTGGTLHVVRDGILHIASNTLHPYPTEIIRNYCCDASCWEHLHQASMFWKGRLWHAAKGLDASLHFAGDYELWPRFARHAPFVHLAVPLCIYRSRTGQLSLCDEYVLEKEKIVPLAVRQARIRDFWRKRIRPPHAPALSWNGQAFGLVSRCAWPMWGSGWTYYKRRLRYTCRQIVNFMKQCTHFCI